MSNIFADGAVLRSATGNRSIGWNIVKDDAYNLYTLGCEMLSIGNPGQAAHLLQRACLLEEGKSSIWEALGRARFAMRQHEDALEAFEKVLEIDPSNHYAHYCLAVYLEVLGQLEAAGGHIKLALAMAPDNEDYEVAYARIRMRRSGRGDGET